MDRFVADDAVDFKPLKCRGHIILYDGLMRGFAGAVVELGGINRRKASMVSSLSLEFVHGLQRATDELVFASTLGIFDGKSK